MTAATHFGRPLQPGGTIGVAAPASPYDARSEILRGVEWWETQGYKVKLADVWAEVKKLPAVGNARVGQFYEPLSFEQNTSDFDADFMERSLMNALRSTSSRAPTIPNVTDVPHV